MISLSIDSGLTTSAMFQGGYHLLQANLLSPGCVVEAARGRRYAFGELGCSPFAVTISSAFPVKHLLLITFRAIFLAVGPQVEAP
jgi:hypothetical protein